MDKVNLKIIRILQEKARIPNVDVARRIDMAPSAVLERIRKLEKQGYIDGYEVRLNPEKFNRKMIAFIMVKENADSMNNRLGDALSKITGVQEVHYVSGNDSYLVKIRVSGHEKVRRIVRENIQSQPGVHSTKTSIVLESFKEKYFQSSSMGRIDITMPMSQDFEHRLNSILEKIVNEFGTPFHIYDEKGIRNTGRFLLKTFSDILNFREFFAVKALPNPRIMELMLDMGFGFDCSSITELMLSRRIGAKPDDIMFTSNNTSREEFQNAFSNNGCIMNLDDITLIDKMLRMSELICFRYNPGPRRTGNSIIGIPEEAKYGVSHEQIVDAYKLARDKGATRFGLHTMLLSNEINHEYIIQTVKMLLELVEEVSSELGISFEFINIGGGLGIPYHPDEAPLDLSAIAGETKKHFAVFNTKHGYTPALYVESGRFMTGPHGALVVTAINQKDTYRKFIGVDACMSSLMRPAIYNAYHHITVHNKKTGPSDVLTDVVGSLCENNDKFAIQRPLPFIEDGDILMIHDTGAHGHSLGFNYNGRLRPKELLLRENGSVELIRREEVPEDYFATLNFEPSSIVPNSTGFDFTG